MVAGFGILLLFCRGRGCFGVVCCFLFFNYIFVLFFFFQAEDGIRDLVRSRGLGDVYKRQCLPS